MSLYCQTAKLEINLFDVLASEKLTNIWYTEADPK